jgi:hypothetical protein
VVAQPFLVDILKAQREHGLEAILHEKEATTATQSEKSPRSARGGK